MEDKDGMEPQPDTEGGVPTLEELADKKWQRDVAAMFGINLKPSAGDIWDILEYLTEQAQRIPLTGDESYYGDATLRSYVEQRRTNEFWAEAMTLLAPYGGYGSVEAEPPGDPLKSYFDATDRFFNTMLGPFPEASYLGIPRYKEAFQTLTPSNFDEWLQGQEKTLRTQYEAQIFNQMQPVLEQYGAELAALPAEQRYERMLGMASELNLGSVPTYESFLQEQLPRLQTQFRYMKPLPEEAEAAGAFANIFGEAGVGEQVTPMGQFFAGRERALQSEYETLVREQLRAGAALETLPTLEDYYKTRRPELERSYMMSGPQYTGRTRASILGRPQRII